MNLVVDCCPRRRSCLARLVSVCLVCDVIVISFTAAKTLRWKRESFLGQRAAKHPHDIVHRPAKLVCHLRPSGQPSGQRVCSSSSSREYSRVTLSSSFVTCHVMQVARNLGFNVGQPNMVDLRNDRVDQYQHVIKEVMAENNPPQLVCAGVCSVSPDTESFLCRSAACSPATGRTAMTP